MSERNATVDCAEIQSKGRMNPTCKRRRKLMLHFTFNQRNFLTRQHRGVVRQVHHLTYLAGVVVPLAAEG